MDSTNLDTPEYNELIDVNISMFDSLLNGLIDSGTDLPFVQILNSFYKAGKEVKEYLFKKKLIQFLNEVKKADNEASKKFVEKIKTKGQYKQVGLSMLAIIDHLDEPDKASLIGKLYCYIVDKGMESDVYFRCCHIIDKCYYTDIFQLMHFKNVESIISKNKIVKSEILENLFSVGLLSDVGYDGGGFNDDDDEGTIYSLNDYGRVLIQII